MNHGRKSERLVALACLGLLLFNYPLLSLFSSEDDRVLGVPLLHAYLFTSWALLIALMALVVRRAG